LQIHNTLWWIRIRIHASDEWIRIQIRILDPDPDILVIDLQDANKKLIFNFFCKLLFEATLTSVFKDKKSKRVKNSRNQGFSYYFSTMIEGSGSRAGSGSVHVTSGSGSGRPKNMWIRIRFRIRNTAYDAICIV
jgi:hypothetical protein